MELEPQTHVGPETPAPSICPDRRAWLEPTALVLIALAINLAGNARTGLWDRDEPRYAVAVREMRARGDWLFPSFNGEPRYHKPILIYWLMGLATSFAGDNPFGARLVSSLAGASAVLGVWWMGRRLFGPRGGLVAAAIYATAPIVAAESKLATTDATLALWLLGCQASLWVLSRRPSRWAAAVFWTTLNLAILTKGPVGPAFVAAATLLAWWCGWPLPPRERFHWRWGLASLLGLSCPWFIAVTVASHGEFLRFALGNQVLHRVASDMEAHGGFPGYYAVVSSLVFYPWAALVPAALAGAWGRRRVEPNLSYLLGWIIGPMILLECFRTKLIHYYLPSFPSCALLVAWLALSLTDRRLDMRAHPLGRLTRVTLGAVGLAIAIVLIAGAVILAGPIGSPLLVSAAIVALSSAAGLFSLERGAGTRAVLAMAACWGVVLVILSGVVVPLAEPFRTSRVVGERLAALSRREGVEPVLLEYQEPGVIYALGRPAALTRDRDGYFAHLTGGRSVMTVLLENEIEVMRSVFGLEVTPVDQVEGPWLTKGKYHTLYIAIVRQGLLTPDDEPPAAMTARGGGLEQPLVQ